MKISIILKFILLLSCFISFAKPAQANTKSKLITAKIQTKLSAEQVLKRLKQGNMRYVNKKQKVFNQRDMSRLATKKGQAPYAIIFSCIDSRSVPLF